MLIADDPVRDAVWRMVTETGCHLELARALKRRFHWGGTDRAAVSHLSMMLSPRHAHHFPPGGLLDAIRESGLDYVTPLLLRVRLRKRVRRAVMAKVEPRARRREGCA